MTDRQIFDTIVIAAAPAVVFAIIADPRQHRRIDGSGSVGSVIAAPVSLTGTGQSFTVKMRMFGLPYRMTNRIVEFEPDRLIAWRHVGSHRWRYRLEPTSDGGAKVTETFDFTHTRGLEAVWLRAAGFLTRNRHGITETLVRLKEAAESDAAAMIGDSTPRL